MSGNCAPPRPFVLLRSCLSLSLSCRRAKSISRLSNRLRTLCPKQPGCTQILLYPEGFLRGANLELGTLFYPERLPRGVPRAATHLFLFQRIAHSLQKQPGCTQTILYPEVSSREANLQPAPFLPPDLPHRFQSA